MISIAIMAHPDRRRHVRTLQRELPNAEVAWDRRSDRWDTGRRALLAYDPEAEWHVVVQDDAVLCRAFEDRATRALREAGQGPVSFFLPKTAEGPLGIERSQLREARIRKVCWFRAQGPLWGVAIAVRTERITDMVAWCDCQAIRNYDLRQAAYWETRGVACSYSIPSLVDHRVGRANPSLVEGRGASRRRTAMWFRRRAPAKWTPKAMRVEVPA